MAAATSHWQRRGYSVAAMRDLARARVPRPIFEFLDGGAEDERTLRRNEDGFGDIDFVPHPLTGVGPRDLSVELFGKRLELPLVIAPTGLSGLYWPDGERCAARAAAGAGAGFCLSHASICSMEELAENKASPRWMQVFVYRDRTLTRHFVERAAAAGYDALVLTVDSQLIGNRERDIRNGFTNPPHFSLGELIAMIPQAPWLWRMRRELRGVNLGNYTHAGEVTDLYTAADKLPALLDPTMSWADVDLLRSWWKGPLIVKGVLDPAEANEAVARGVDGIVVSNHGGRQLDGALASIDALPAIAERVAGRIPILLDSGVRRGSDVVKAMALGASACLIGRPHLYGLTIAGEAGVSHVLEIFRREIDRVICLCGVATMAGVTPSLVRRAAHR